MKIVEWWNRRTPMANISSRLEDADHEIDR